MYCFDSAHVSYNWESDKIRYFCRSLMTCSLSFCFFDRYCRYFCSSTLIALRRWSNIRVVSYMIPFTVLVIGLVYLHVPFNHTIVLPQRTCDVASITYRSLFTIWTLVFFSWIPCLSMFTFGLLTIRNVRRSRTRVASQNSNQQNQNRTDRQLIHMLTIQFVVFASTTMGHSICQLYVSITSNTTQLNALERAKNNYLIIVSNWISIVGPCLSFYLFTLSSKLFRCEVIGLFKQRRPVQGQTNPNFTEDRWEYQFPNPLSIYLLWILIFAEGIIYHHGRTESKPRFPRNRNFWNVQLLLFLLPLCNRVSFCICQKA